jgi:hypothetical protein
MPVLSSEQEAALLALDWLFDNSDEQRGQGRSTVIAIALIRHALVNPGVRVTVRDHADPREADRHLAGLMGRLIATDPSLTNLCRLDLLSNNRGQPILYFEEGVPEAENWLPPNWAFSGAERNGVSEFLRLPDWTRLPLPEDSDERDVPDEFEALFAPFFEASRVNAPADRTRTSPTRQAHSPPPLARQSLWDLLDED